MMADNESALHLRAERERQEKIERVSGFVRQLLEMGQAEIVVPLGQESKKIILTCRVFSNPNPNLIGSGDRFVGFTEAFIINLFEEVSDSAVKFLPIGHRDFKTVLIGEEMRASGNFAVSPQTGIASHNFSQSLNKSMELADRIFSMNGIEIVDSPDKASGTSDDIDYQLFRKVLEENNLPTNQSWRHLGLGKFLIGLELEILKQKGVKSLEIFSLSEYLEPIFEKIFAQSQPTDSRKDHLDLSKVKPEIYADFVDRFIPKEKK